MLSTNSVGKKIISHPDIFHNKVVDDEGVTTSADTQAMGREIENVAYLLGPSNISIRGSNDLE